MMNAAKKLPVSFNPEPVLRSIFMDAEIEHREVEQMFELLGWSDLPETLKFEIKDDVKGYVDELKGNYSTNSPFVQRRRESVDFWVNSFCEGICSLGCAVDSLKCNTLT